MDITNDYILEVMNKVFDTMDSLFKDEYMLMNKYTEVPYKLPSDLDIDITQRDFEHLDEYVSEVARQTGLVVTQKIWHNYRKCAYILTPLHITQRFRLQLDFFSDFSFTNTPLLIPFETVHQHIRRYERFVVPDYDLEYVFLLLRRIYKGDFDEEHVSIIRNVFINDEVKCRKFAEKYFGEKWSDFMAEAVIKNDIAAFKSKRDELCHLVRHISSKNSSISYKCRYWATQLKRAVYRIKYPVGMYIALLSPDGGGKTTIFEKLTDSCWGSFHGIEKCYFRPRLLKNAGHYKPINPTEESSSNKAPHKVKLDGRLKSFLRFFFYNLDFAFGYWLKIFRKIVQKKLVVFDRYYYDYYVDMLRYKYHLPNWMPRMFSFMIPNPHIVFVLTGDAETIYLRKKEISLEETKRQIAAYEKISSYVRNVRFVNVDRDIKVITEDITTQVLLEKARQTAKAMGNVIDENGIPV